jgi:hypothetical protein
MSSAKNTISQIVSFSRERSQHFGEKRKDKELANWSSGTGSSWRRWLDSPDRAMARVLERCWCVSTNESMGIVWLGRCSYLFTHIMCSNG